MGNSPVPVNSPHKGQWRGALMFSLICVWINGWVNSREAGDLRHHRGHYDVNVIRWLEWNCDFRKEQPCKVRFRQFIRTTNSQNTTHSSAAKVRYGRVLYIMTSSNGNIFRVTAWPLCGEFTGTGEFPAQRPVTRSFDVFFDLWRIHVFFDLRLNKRLSKQLWRWWFETPSWSLWRHCNDL